MVAATNQKLIAEVERIVLTRVAAGKLVLPTMPAVATKCLDIIKSPDFNFKKLVEPIESEPLLATMMIRAASTAAAGNAVMSVDRAVQRLGAQRLKTLLLEYASRAVFKSADKRINAASKAIWDHSVVVAYLSRDIAAMTGNSDGDGCYLAGLLHDIGKPVVAAMLLDAEKNLARGAPSWLDIGVWSATIDATHRKVGVAIATEWKLPDEITSAIRDCSDYDSANRAAIANIVRLANAIAKQEGFATGAIDKDDVEAMVMVGRSLLGIDEALLGKITAALKTRMPAA